MFLRFSVAALILAWMMSGGGAQCTHAAGCGTVPIRPIPPIGCRDLRPSCMCNSTGTECHWEWICVR